ncbi:MAG: putative quinol monooxygenase [Bilophila sp.]
MIQYYITAKLTAKPDKVEALLAAILANIPRVRAEQGCLRYDLHSMRDDGTTFLFYEIWANKAAFSAHGEAPHMLTYREEVKAFLAKPTEVTIWQDIDTM